MSELLREEQGKRQVAQQKNGQNQRDDGNDINVHGRLSQLLAGLDVKKGHGKEDYGENQHR
jgi:hypothetical protein